jgi:hypothetical protein
MATGGAKRMVKLVRPDEVRSVWGEVWPKLHSAVELESEADLFAELEAGNRYLLLAGDGAAVVRNCRDFLEVNYVGGSNISAWKDEMDEAICAIAKDLGLKRLVALGRKGWTRIWPGYRNTDKVFLVRDL